MWYARSAGWLIVKASCTNCDRRSVILSKSPNDALYTAVVVSQASRSGLVRGVSPDTQLNRVFAVAESPLLSALIIARVAAERR
jgi:hypothetical protein